MQSDREMLLSANDVQIQQKTYGISSNIVRQPPAETKHTRQRSESWNAPKAAFYSSSIVPAPSQHEALSSLITSLSSTSDEYRPHVATVQSKTTHQRAEDRVDLADHISADSRLAKTSHTNKSSFGIVQIENEADICPPPVAGYNTINADTALTRPPTSAGGKPSRRFKDKDKGKNLKLRTLSQVNLKSSKPSRGLRTPESRASSTRPGTSYGDDSIASESLSTNSKLSRTKSPFKMFFSQSPSHERNNMTPSPMPYMAESFETAHSSPDKEKDRDLRFSAFVTLGKISTDIEPKESDARTLDSLSPSLRENLDQTLIPSRRSSLRSGLGRRSSRGSKDLKSLNIDQDLIEENNETVQRIRELQQAREQRQKEWRREARRSEKAAKRMSLPTSNPSPARQTGSVRSSWHSKMLDSPEETPESEEPPKMSARINGNDLSTMPAFVETAENIPLTPVEKPRIEELEGSLRRNLSITASTTQSLSPVRRHRNRLSDSIKRASSIRQHPSDDVKGIADDVDAFLGSPRFTQKIRHPRTGRTIAFSEVGDPGGFVVFCCVGMGLTRYVTTFYDEIAKAQKLRIITPDRPGVSETDAMPAERSTPLAWVDDVAVICSSLGIEKFSLLAHSAGAIYALAAALKMPQYVRGRIHLLAPWIPPSQLASSTGSGTIRPANLPTSHKILSLLPASFMKAANSRFLSATSASIEPRTRKNKKGPFGDADLSLDPGLFNQEPSLSTADMSQSYGSILPMPGTTTAQQLAPPDLSAYQVERFRVGSPPVSPTLSNNPRLSTLSSTPSSTRTPTGNHQTRVLTPFAREKLHNQTLTHRTWALATLNANPAVDLIICLERRRPIGFKYSDITRAVVIHHGANDTRVPLENVKWLSSAMKRCELRVLQNEGHGLMASAAVMSNVLGEIGREWDEWNAVAKAREIKKREDEAREQELIQEKEKERGIRRGYPRW